MRACVRVCVACLRDAQFCRSVGLVSVKGTGACVHTCKHKYVCVLINSIYNCKLQAFNVLNK